MKIQNILFDMGFTLISVENFEIKKYLKGVSKNIEYLQSYLIQKKFISNENFGSILKKNQKKYFLKSYKTDMEFSTEFILEQTFKEIGLKSDVITRELLDLCADILYSKDADYWKAYPDVGSTLEKLKCNGFRMAIVSNAPWHKGVIKMLESNGIIDFFDIIISSACAKARKPKPEIFNLALLKLNAKISNTVFVGDDLYCDIYGAQNLGMKTIHFNKGFELPSPRKIKVKPDKQIKKISEIIPIINDWNNNTR
ncbi:MAG: HAD family hydrolase [Candidatus Helarchaeota archaeon]